MKRRFWTEQEDQWLREHYPDTPMEELVEHLDRTPRAIYNRARHYLGVRRTDEAIRESTIRARRRQPENKGEFKKGNIPFNKGLKRSEWMSEEGKAICAKTQFQKGLVPHNTQEVGYESISKKEGYIYMKVAEGEKMVLKHRYVWEQHNGAIPKGYNVQFKDGNRQNCDIDNLYIISRAEQMSQENSLHRYPAELKTAIFRLGKIRRVIKKNS